MKGTDNAAVVMRDLNDDLLSVSNEILYGDRHYRRFYLSKTGRRSDRGLYSTAQMQQLRSFRDVYYTYIHEGFRTTLDHILVSEQFYDYSDKHKWTFRELRPLGV